jgi:4-hydroxy-tetrahydrodipicolinate synthase
MEKIMRRHEQIQSALASPMPSLRSPFRRDGSIDQHALRTCVERAIANGAKSLMLTFGDSHFSVLTDAEVELVTRIVVETARGRACVIAADRGWWTGKTAEFAAFARGLGADILMVMAPDWAQSCTPQTLVDHHRVIADIMPVMMVTNYLAPRKMEFRMEVIERIHAEVENVIAVKDDVLGDFGDRMTRLVRDRWTVIAGGLKTNHLRLARHGAQGHLSTLILFKPDIAHRYWNAITRGDFEAAESIVRDYDVPMIDALVKCPGGFDAGMRGWLELTGIGPRWRRNPYRSLSDEELAAFAESLRKAGLLD